MQRYPSAEVIVRSLLLLPAVVATVAACGAQSSGGASASGLYGTVRLSPSSPLCARGTSCSKPARNFKLLFRSNGRTVTAKTDAKGHYRVQLDAGTYAVRAGTVSMLPKSGLRPRTVKAATGAFAKRDFVYDSGIR
jgi:hypothetical protein